MTLTTLRAPILDDTMTHQEVVQEARAGLVPALLEHGLRLRGIRSISVSGDDDLEVVIVADVTGPGDTPTPPRPGEGKRSGPWRQTGDRRAIVAALVAQGFTSRQIAMRVFGDYSDSSRRRIERDRAALRDELEQGMRGGA